MALRPILRYPHADLRRPALAIEKFDAALQDLAKDLLETMRAAPGIGMTAPHVGVLARLLVLDLPETTTPEFYVNPVILEFSKETARHQEGSVSMPGVTAEIERPSRISLRYQTLSGESLTLQAEGLRSLCLQHEIDQLDGLFWLQRLSRLQRERMIKRFEKLQRLG
jgi:peptide deformylase